MVKFNYPKQSIVAILFVLPTLAKAGLDVNKWNSLSLPQLPRADTNQSNKQIDKQIVDLKSSKKYDLQKRHDVPPPIKVTAPSHSELTQTDPDCDKIVPKLSKEAQDQRDEIYSLLTYAVVVKDFQGPFNRHPKRGFNIGAVLVDPKGEPVWWERNSNVITCSGAEHAEIRSMITYLEARRAVNLKCHTFYTSLEPCAMCAGMMTMQMVMRTVYGMSDPDFGGALERLHVHLDGKPYPRSTVPVASNSNFKREFNDDFEKFIKNTNNRKITDYLMTTGAQNIFERAKDKFINYKNRAKILPENEAIYERALKFFDENVTDYYMSKNQRILADANPSLKKPSYDDSSSCMNHSMPQPVYAPETHGKDSSADVAQ